MNALELKELREKAGLTQEEMAHELHLSAKTISNWETKRGIPKNKENWIRNFLVNYSRPTISNLSNVKASDTSEILTNKNGNVFELQNGKFRMFVKQVPVKAFGSYLSDYQDPDFFDSLEEVEFTVSHLGRGNYISFEVKGDSMNGGKIDDTKDGADLLCRELGRQHWKDGFRDSPLGWVIVHKDTVVFKDIKSVDMETGDMVLSSRSGLPQHPDFTVNLNDVRQIWKVIKRTQD